MGLLDINLGEMLGNLMDILLWNWLLPIWEFVVSIFIGFLNTLYTLVLMLIDIINLGIVLVSFLTTFLGLFMEDAFSSIILAQISLIIVLRVYYFIKGMQIAGFGI